MIGDMFSRLGSNAGSRIGLFILIIALHSFSLCGPVEGTAHECRLWAMIADNPPDDIVQNHLISDYNSLENLSLYNPDGWGIVYGYTTSQPADLLTHRGQLQASMDDDYDLAVLDVASTARGMIAAHIRRASSGIPTPATGDPHPFVKTISDEAWVLAHNGTFSRSPLDQKSLLYQLIRPDFFNAHYPEYGTDIDTWIDSELLFIFILQTMSDHGFFVDDPNAKQLRTVMVKYALGDAIARIISAMGDGPYPAFNFYLTDGATLWAFSYSPENPMIDPLYLYYSPGYVVVASQPTSQDGAGWIATADEYLITISPGGRTEIEPIQNYASWPSASLPSSSSAGTFVLIFFLIITAVIIFMGERRSRLSR